MTARPRRCDVLDKVRVQASSRVAVVAFFSRQRPQDDGLDESRECPSYQGVAMEVTQLRVVFYVRVCYYYEEEEENVSHNALYSYTYDASSFTSSSS